MIHKIFIKLEDKLIARVTFELPDGIWTDAIYLVGDFNNWQRTTYPMQRERTGKWWLTVDLELGHAYQFRYLAGSDHWLNDSNADAYVLNPYGTDNFVVVTDPAFKPYCDKRDSLM